jgi:DtxR family Mn-dependent transcriptional regulator
MSEAVERRIVALLAKPLVCPHGNPIPGLDELGLPFATNDDHAALLTLSAAVDAGLSTVVVDRISEQLQPDAATMHDLTRAGLRPGQKVEVSGNPEGVEVWSGEAHLRLSRQVTDHVFVRSAEALAGTLA